MDSGINKTNLKIRDMCFIALFVAVIAVLAQVSVPLPLGVPFTMQTFAVMLAGIILGAKKAVVALIIYLLLGAVGAPVFTQFGGGFHRIIGPWGGFLMSYPFVALIIGLGSDSGKKILLAGCLAVGVIINLSMGMFWFAFNTGIGLQEAFTAAFAPFIIPEIIKLILAFSVGVPVRHILKKAVY